MRLAEMVQTSERVAATASRLEKVATLTDFLVRVPREQVAASVNFLSGQLTQVTGVGGALLRSVRATPSVTEALTLADLVTALDEFPRLRGAGSNAARAERLRALFASATEREQHFLHRLFSGELRQGAQEGVMIEAVARAGGAPASDVRRAAMVAGDLAGVAQVLLNEGASSLQRFSIRLLQPIQPMLAQAAADVDEALLQLHEAAFDYKLDGARVQVHKDGADTRVYTRNLKDVTASVPEIVEAVQRLPASQLILEGEAIALAADSRPLPFQVSMRRFGRKQDVESLRATLPLSVFFFDCLHRDGEDVIAQAARERFRLLAETVPDCLRIPRCVTADKKVAQAFLTQALAAGHEGLVAKSLDAPYEAGRRGSAWLKIKPAQTLDLVVLAAEWGNGRRQGWLSNLHLGARDPETGEYVMLGKTFKGMTDQMLAWQTERLQALAVSRDAGTVYVRPEMVVEIAFNNIQSSSHYPGGFALRFARVKRYREDKRAEEADTIQTVRAFYASEHGGGERESA